MTFVVDANLIVAALTDEGDEGAWASALLAEGHLAAPHLMPVEVTNVLRRAIFAGKISEDAASMAQGDLLDLRVVLFPYRPLAERVWELRDNLTAYDAWYVALAESLDARLATLDGKLARAPGISCEVMIPS